MSCYILISALRILIIVLGIWHKTNQGSDLKVNTDAKKGHYQGEGAIRVSLLLRKSLKIWCLTLAKNAFAIQHLVHHSIVYTFIHYRTITVDALLIAFLSSYLQDLFTPTTFWNGFRFKLLKLVSIRLYSRDQVRRRPKSDDKHALLPTPLPQWCALQLVGLPT